MPCKVRLQLLDKYAGSPPSQIQKASRTVEEGTQHVVCLRGMCFMWPPAQMTAAYNMTCSSMQATFLQKATKPSDMTSSHIVAFLRNRIVQLEKENERTELTCQHAGAGHCYLPFAHEPTRAASCIVFPSSPTGKPIVPQSGVQSGPKHARFVLITTLRRLSWPCAITRSSWRLQHHILAMWSACRCHDVISSTPEVRRRHNMCPYVIIAAQRL